jgi:hypothetical protein
MSNKDRATDTFRLTIETVPGSFKGNTAKHQILSGVDGIKDATLEAVCPVCGDPFLEAGRVGFNHPIDLEEEIESVCLGPDEKFSDGVGGLTWMYSHTE